MLRSRVGAIVLTLALTGSLTACASAGAISATVVTVSVEHCGSGWTNPRSGQQTFELSNTDIGAGEVFLVRAGSADVVAYVDNVAPGATANLALDLGSGRYQFRCAMADRDVAHGPVVDVPGNTAGTATAVAAVTQNELIPVTKQYQSWVIDALPALQADVASLARDLDSGNLSLARSDWLTAHLAYERLGGAYGSFGPLAKDVDSTSTGLANGTQDANFVGFHRIEYGLWHGQAASQLAPYGTELVTIVSKLADSVAETRVEPLDVAIRAHEIAENALQFDLTGESDYGSGTELASVSAELDGTSELVTLLTPVLTDRYTDLHTAVRHLNQTKRDVAALDIDGARTPLDSLTTTERERIDSDLSELTGLLAPIASICEPRTTG